MASDMTKPQHCLKKVAAAPLALIVNEYHRLHIIAIVARSKAVDPLDADMKRLIRSEDAPSGSSAIAVHPLDAERLIRLTQSVSSASEQVSFVAIFAPSLFL